MELLANDLPEPGCRPKLNESTKADMIVMVRAVESQVLVGTAADCTRTTANSSRPCSVKRREDNSGTADAP